jgi:hypothetical protein
MVIDFKADAAHAFQFSVFDAETGRKLDGELSIFYADDQAGILKVYQRDGHSNTFVIDPETGRPAVEVLRRKINIVPKR